MTTHTRVWRGRLCDSRYWYLSSRVGSDSFRGLLRSIQQRATVHRKAGVVFVYAMLTTCVAGNRADESHVWARGHGQWRHEERNAGVSVISVWSSRKVGERRRSSDDPVGGHSRRVSDCQAPVAHVVRALRCGAVILYRTGRRIPLGAPYPSFARESSAGGARDHAVLAVARAYQTDLSGHRWCQRV
jgi:hypothetical protein